MTYGYRNEIVFLAMYTQLLGVLLRHRQGTLVLYDGKLMTNVYLYMYLYTYICIQFTREKLQYENWY